MPKATTNATSILDFGFLVLDVSQLFLFDSKIRERFLKFLTFEIATHPLSPLSLLSLTVLSALSIMTLQTHTHLNDSTHLLEHPHATQAMRRLGFNSHQINDTTLPPTRLAARRHALANAIAAVDDETKRAKAAVQLSNQVYRVRPAEKRDRTKLTLISQKKISFAENTDVLCVSPFTII